MPLWLPYLLLPVLLGLLVHLPITRHLRPYGYWILGSALLIWTWTFGAVTRSSAPADAEMATCGMPVVAILFAQAFYLVVVTPMSILLYFVLNRLADMLAIGHSAGR